MNTRRSSRRRLTPWSLIPSKGVLSRQETGIAAGEKHAGDEVTGADVGAVDGPAETARLDPDTLRHLGPIAQPPRHMIWAVAGALALVMATGAGILAAMDMWEVDTRVGGGDLEAQTKAVLATWAVVALPGIIAVAVWARRWLKRHHMRCAAMLGEFEHAELIVDDSVHTPRTGPSLWVFCHTVPGRGKAILHLRATTAGQARSIALQHKLEPQQVFGRASDETY